MDNYKSALIACGATVYNFQEFGDYSGSWYAVVEYNNLVGLAKGDYGSCSGCDAFEDEFACNTPTKDRLAQFGKQYLDSLITVEEALEKVNDYASWDLEAKSVIDWLESQKKLIHDLQFNAKFKREILE